jgi:preprotein translocase subunit SecE
VARNRQKAKQRQAERRAARLESRGTTGDAGAPERAVDGRGAEPAGEPVDVLGDGTASAPPEDTGRSDTVVASPPWATADLDADPGLDADPALPELEAAALEAEAAEARLGRADRRAEDAAVEALSAPERNRVLAFLAAVWAELRRVQWPNRQAVISLTGIVLGFVALAGGYLGLLDAIFSRLIQGIL